MSSADLMSVIEILAFFRLFFHPANKEAKADGCHVNPMSTEANFSAPVLVMRVRNFNWQAGGSAGIFLLHPTHPKRSRTGNLI